MRRLRRRRDQELRRAGIRQGRSGFFRESFFVGSKALYAKRALRTRNSGPAWRVGGFLQSPADRRRTPDPGPGRLLPRPGSRSGGSRLASGRCHGHSIAVNPPAHRCLRRCCAVAGAAVEGVSPPPAAWRLTRLPHRCLRRWLCGCGCSGRGGTRHRPPLRLTLPTVAGMGSAHELVEHAVGRYIRLSDRWADRRAHRRVLGSSFGGSARRRDAGPPPRYRRERSQLAFFAATFSIMGHVAKADGRVSAEEIRLANRVMDHLGLDLQQRQAAPPLSQRKASRPVFP